MSDREKALQAMKKAQANGDQEAAHNDADNALCVLLISLGYEDVVTEYNKVEKWYA